MNKEFVIECQDNYYLKVIQKEGATIIECYNKEYNEILSKCTYMCEVDLDRDGRYLIWQAKKNIVRKRLKKKEN